MMRSGWAAWAAVMLALSVGGATSAQDMGEVEASYEAALAVTSTPVSLAAEQAAWARDGGGDPETRAWRIEALGEQAARDRRVRTLRPAATDLGRGCIDIGLKGCVSERGGYITRRDGPTLYWQVQDGFTDADGISSGFVLLALQSDGRTLMPLAWSVAPARYQAPRWVDASDGAVVLTVPGTYHGTGAHNADLMFRWDGSDARLVQIDNLSWWDDLDARLPEGLGAWKGVVFLDEGLSAHTALWRSDDGNCCPTGGEAMLDFQIENDRLVLTEVRATDALARLAERIPADVFAWVQRWEGCAHWGGEEPYDAERAAEIAAALRALNCETLEADEQALRAAHAARPAILEAIERARAF